MSRLPRGVLVSTFLRSFTIQGSWNYRTMLGGGFAFAMLPVLRWVSRNDREALARGLTRHLEHFNAHPYMASLALGATARLELDEGAPGPDFWVRRPLEPGLGRAHEALTSAPPFVSFGGTSDLLRGPFVRSGGDSGRHRRAGLLLGRSASGALPGPVRLFRQPERAEAEGNDVEGLALWRMPALPGAT